MILLIDVDECHVKNGGCSHTCINSDGGYSCTCKNGYTLYTTNGTESLTIPPEETGKLDGDIYHLDHTCVRKYASTFTFKVL